MNVWSDSGFFANGVHNLTPKECYKLCEQGAIIIDVREEYMSSVKMFRVENLRYMPFSRIGQLYSELPDERPLIFADAVGLKSRESVLFMMSQGYRNVANMAGGIVDWERDGLPVTTDITSRLSGSCMCQLKTREKRKSNQ